MVVSEATLALTKRDETPVTEAPVPPQAADASKSSRGDPWPVDQHLTRQEAYVMVDAPKKLHIHHDGHHNVAGLGAGKEGSGGREFRAAFSSLQVRAYHEP